MFQFQTFNCPLLAKKLCICGMRIFLNFDPTILLDAPLNLLFHIQTGRNCIVQNCGGNCTMVVKYCWLNSLMDSMLLLLMTMRIISWNFWDGDETMEYYGEIEMEGN